MNEGITNFIDSKKSNMCGRYTLITEATELAGRFEVDVTKNYDKLYNAAPSELLPVITSANRGGFSFFYWGLIPGWSNNKSISLKLINARAETIMEKPSFKTALSQRRCLVPADGFYEWKRVSKKGKVPYRFMINNNEPFAFAGLWDEFEDDKGEMMHTFTIITTEPNDVTKEVHDRMPAILTQEAEKLWLDESASDIDLLDVLRPYPAEKMGTYPVSSKVNNAKYKGADSIASSSPVDQFGNYSLFD